MPWQCDAAAAVATGLAATVVDHLLDLAAAAAAADGGEGGEYYHLQHLRAGADGTDVTIRQYQQLQ